MVVITMSSIEFNAFSQKWKPTVRVCATKHLSKHLNKLYPIPSPKRYFLSIQVKSLSWARNFFFARTSHCVPLLPKQSILCCASKHFSRNNKNTWNNGDFYGSMFIPGDSLCFLHQQHSKTLRAAHKKKNTVHSQASTNSCQLSTTYLMLEFRWITSTDRNHTAVTMATRSRNKLISNCTIAPNLIGQKKIK